jgi:hypothetical protein
LGVIATSRIAGFAFVGCGATEFSIPGFTASTEVSPEVDDLGDGELIPSFALDGLIGLVLFWFLLEEVLGKFLSRHPSRRSGWRESGFAFYV